MHPSRKYFARLGAGAGLLTVLAAGAVLPVAADNTVSQTINGGTRSASIANLTLGAVSYSHSAQSSTGTLAMTADDSTGSGNGWNVTVQSDALVLSGGDGSHDIAASALSIGTPGTPSATAGQAVDGTNGPRAGSGGALDSARKVIYANADYGMGTYTQNLPLSVAIPARARAGSYSATLTVTNSSGPGA
jgi:hypothetical protein